MYRNRRKVFVKSSKKSDKKRLATVATVKKMIDKIEETHIFDYSSGSLTVGNSWNIACISNVVKGDTVNDRSGDKISPTAISVRLDCIMADANTMGDIIRVVLFRDKQARGATPSAADLGLSGGGYEVLNHFKASDNYQGRFEKLYDKVFVFETTRNYQLISIYKRLKGVMRFGTEGSDYENNALFLAICCRDTSDNKMTQWYKSRLWFKDA